MMTSRRNVNQPRSNLKNDRVKREYLIYLKDARQRSPKTVEQVRHAIDRLETYTGFRDFATFNKDQALGFKRALLGSRAQRTASRSARRQLTRSYRPSRNFWRGCNAGPGIAAALTRRTLPTST